MYDKIADIDLTVEGTLHTFRFDPKDYTADGLNGDLFNELSSYIAKLTNQEHVPHPYTYITVNELVDNLSHYTSNIGYTFCSGFERDQPITERWTSRLKVEEEKDRHLPEGFHDDELVPNQESND